jgi:hypothetical protein
MERCLFDNIETSEAQTILMELDRLYLKCEDEKFIVKITSSIANNTSYHSITRSGKFSNENLVETWKTVQNSNFQSKNFKDYANIIFFMKIAHSYESLEEARIFAGEIKYIIDWLDEQSASESSLVNLEQLAMRKLLEMFPHIVVPDGFNEILESQIIFNNELLFDFGILKKDENNAVTFWNIKTAITVFGSSYLIRNCEKDEVIDLIIEMVADENYSWSKSNCFHGGKGNIILLILKELQESCGKRLMENVSEGSLQRIFSKELKQRYDLVMLLILSAIKHGDHEIVRKMMKEINEDKQETCLHRIARNCSSFLNKYYCSSLLDDFLKIILERKLVDSLDDWLSKKNSDGKTFLFFMKDPSQLVNILEFF